MALALMRRCAWCLFAVSGLCFGADDGRVPYSPVQYLKNYALSACIADGYRSAEVANDATAGANGYKELGSLDIDAYNEALALSKKYLVKEYKSIGGEKLTVMKCIDLFHSKELDRIARKYAAKK